MIDTVTLGKRLKYFCERAKLSQFDVEVKLDMAPGSLSRIESGKTNPKKETITAITQLCDINDKELDYLIGITSQPASSEEVSKAILEVSAFLDQKVFAYLIDERWRLWSISKHFQKALGIDQEYVNSVHGTATIRFVTDPDLRIVDRFTPESLRETLDNNLRFFYKEVGFMNDDQSFIEAVRSIQKNPIASEIWQQINYEKDIKYNFKFGRKAVFRLIKGIDVPFVYTYESLLKNFRFKVVEFIPESRFIKLLSKII